MTLKAKPDTTLKEHLFQTRSNAEKLLNQTEPSATLKKEYGEKIPEIGKSILVSSLLHDIGKADKRFQKYLKGKRSSSPPHALLSLPIVEQILQKGNFQEKIKNYSLLSIASHHSPLHHHLYKSRHSELLPELSKELNPLLRELGFSEVKIKEEPAYKVMKKARKELRGYKDKKDRQLFIFLQGIIQRADYYASSNQEIEPIKHPQNILVGKDPYRHQKRAKNIKKDLFVPIPTGRGKTESSLFWAKQQERNNIFYILPTMSTINAMYKRLKGFYGKQTGFYHSNSDVLLKEEDKLENALSYKYFLNPVNVTTPDQLLLTFLNYKRYAVKEVKLMDSAFVFDEIHTYSPKTFYLIKHLLKHLKEEYQSPLCIMSATFPKFFEKELDFLDKKRILPREKIREEYSKLKRTKPIYRDENLQENLQEIVKDYKKGKKVLAVLNTVKRSQETYKSLEKIDEVKKEDLVLLHSRFTRKHRMEKENKLEEIEKSNQKGKIFIATQVIEVSLDIDYDVLYTELAPIDSIVQRLGRINRRGKKPLSESYIFNPPSHHPYDRRYIKVSRELISDVEYENENTYRELTDIFYNDLENQIKSKEKEAEKQIEKIRKDVTKYVYSIRNLSEEKASKILQTRDNLMTVSLFPFEFKDKIETIEEEIEELYKNNKKEKARRKQVEKNNLLTRVPTYYSNYIQNQKYIQLDYDEEMGLYDPQSENKVL